MINVFSSLRGIFKLDSVCIDNHVFRMHTKITFFILMASSLIITARQFFGEPIHCMSESVPSPIMDLYCWVYSTFTISKHLTGEIGKNIIQPGVGPFDSDLHEMKHQKYYQWVCFILFIQALCSYFPRFLWKIWEGRRVQMLVRNINYLDVTEPHNSSNKKNIVVNYIVNRLNLFNTYAYLYFLCEVLNLINVIVQACFIDHFLDGEFSTYGSDVLTFTDLEPEERVDPMAKIFPKVTKCTFRRYGPTGTVQVTDALCMLPLNIINEKIYVLLWFWFIILAVASILAVIYRVTVILSPTLRLLLLRISSPLSPRSEIVFLFKKCKIGDFFFLRQLGKNIEAVIFKDIIAELTKKLGFEGIKTV